MSDGRFNIYGDGGSIGVDGNVAFMLASEFAFMLRSIASLLA